MRSVARTGPRVALAALLVGIAAAASLAAPGGARAETLEERFAAHLKALPAARGLTAHWHLTEAQRLAPSLAGGIERLLPLARGLAERSRVAYLQGEALGTVGHLSQAEDPEASRGLLAQAGILGSGLVLGPLAGPGTATDAQAADALELTALVPGQRGQVGWRRFADAALHGTLQLADLLDTEGDAHALLVFGLDAAKPTDAMVVVGSSGPVAVWLDGQPLVDWDGERAVTDWQHAFPVRLEAGAHRLVVRAGHRSEAPELIARVVDARGRLPQGVTVRTPAPGEALAGFAPSKKLPAPLGAFEGVDPALAGRMALSVDAEPPERRVAARLLEQAIARAPQDAELHYLLGRAERSDPNRQRAAFERAVELSNGRHAAALAELLAAHRRADLLASADELFRKLQAVDPAHPAGLLHQVWRTAQLGDATTARAAMQRMSWPKDEPLLAATWAGLLDEGGAAPEAAEAWARASRLLGGHGEATHKAVQAASRAGMVEAALGWTRDAIARRPYAVSLRILQARTLATSASRPDAALAALSEALAVHPTSADLFEARGRIALVAGDRAGAIADFDRALELKPQHRQLADYRRALIEEGSIADAFAEDVDELLADADDVPRAPEGATYLLDKTVVRVLPSGLSTRFQQQIVRIDGQQVDDRFEEMAFAFTPGEDRVEVVEAEVIRRDGQRLRPRGVFDHRPSGKQQGVYTLQAYKVVQFEELEDGDVVHLQVRTDEIGERNLFGQFFGVVFPVQGAFPKARVEAVVDAPAGRALYAHQVGLPAPERVEADGRQTLSWRAQPMAALAVEPRMPGYGDIGAYANVSTYESWDALAAWYRELIRPQLALSPELQRLARELVEGTTTTEARVRAIQEWVVRNTRYVGIEFGIHGFKPYRVTQVVGRGYGDCKDKASLLVALLEEVGVDAEFVLVRTRDAGRLEGKPATLWAFNHAIAYVPELDVYIDGTSEFAGVGEVPKMDQGAMILHIDLLGQGELRPPRLGRLPVSTAAHNRVVEDSVMTVDARGDATMRHVETIRGTQAPEIRRAFHDASRRTERLAGMLARQHTGTNLAKAEFDGLDALGDPVTVTLEARLPALARVADAALEVPVAIDPHALLERYGGFDTRKQPLVLDYPWQEESKRTFVLPQGASLDALPSPVAITSPFGRFEMSVTAAEGGFRVTEHLTVGVDRVEPADYPDFREFLRQVVSARRTVVKARLP